MDTLLIEKLLKNFKCFKGVYSLDMLPSTLNPPINIIINTDPSYMPGEHWVSIHISEDGFGEYFDSFGIPPLKIEIFNYLEKMCEKGWTYNKVALQHVTSDTCGHYCVLNIIFRCQNLSLQNFISKFNSNTLRNDERMREIFGNFTNARNGQTFER